MKIEKKTAFVTQENDFQRTYLPFGLKSSPAVFQRILNSIIRKRKSSDFTENFVDNILIMSQIFTKHIKYLSLLLEAISKVDFRLKFSKCTFAQDFVKYLGHIIKNNTITPLKDSLIAIKEFPVPQTKKYSTIFRLSELLW